jgi:tetratricopeptide (TPR) repeat protein
LDEGDLFCGDCGAPASVGCPVYPFDRLDDVPVDQRGAPAQAAASYAAAAELSPPDAADGAAARLWERAALGALAHASFPATLEYAERARGQHLRRGRDRDGARVQAIAGRALASAGRHAEAREQLTAAVEVLKVGPDTDTVWAMNRLAVLEVFAGSPDADQLSAEALTLGQALNVGPSHLGELLLTRGLYHALAERRPQAISYLRESARWPPRPATASSWDARCSTWPIP